MSKMHIDEIEVDQVTVKNLIRAQFPEWSHLPIKKLKTSGTVNTIFKLGHDLSIRIPKLPLGVQQIEKEHKWLHELQNSLTLKIPRIIKIGRPNHALPWKWAIYEWIEGEVIDSKHFKSNRANITILSEFLIELQRFNPNERLLHGEHNYFRGEALINRDQITRETIFKLRQFINFKIAEKIWDSGLQYNPTAEEKGWIHGDLQPGNILVHKGKIKAIIDFGALGYGDVSCDLMPAWNLLDRKARVKLREELDIQASTWKRGQAWALTVAAVALEYYMYTNPYLARISHYTLKELERDFMS